MDRSLDTEAQFLKGVGPRFASGFAKLGLRTVRDVLYHFPRRYEDRRHLPPISKIRPGEFATVKGDLMNVESRPTRGGMVILKATIGDGTGVVGLTWFNQPWIGRQLKGYNGPIIAYGLVKEASFGCEINGPEWEMIDEDTDPADFARIVPVYPATEGVSQKSLRKAAACAVEQYLQFVQEPLPDYLRQEQKLQPIRWCLRQIHDPESDEFRAKARKRLVFEEFFYMQVALAMRRAETQQELGIAFPLASLAGGLQDSTIEGLKDWRIEGLEDGDGGLSNPPILPSSNPPTLQSSHPPILQPSNPRLPVARSSRSPAIPPISLTRSKPHSAKASLCGIRSTGCSPST
ncbi:MAG TPA: hypothetical protein VMI31_17005 [Fimbriimonadaceae bacterium]|nr:hypothetical protein [Fimbriimonadaceae bacterium]